MIKNLLFSIVLIVFVLPSKLNAQTCSPDPLYADSLFGIWPDTNDNLPCGLPNVYYETVLQFKMPTEAAQIDPVTYPPGIPVNTVTLSNVSGLPSGIAFTTNTASSNPANQWNGGDQGCALLLGSAAAGTYNVTIDVIGNISIGGQAADVPISFGGYRLIIDPSCDTSVTVSLEERDMGMKIIQNVPNPFSTVTSIDYRLPKSDEVNFLVYDALGKNVHQETLRGQTGLNTIEFNRGVLPKGIYLYQLNTTTDKVSGKMVVAAE
jgi:hypothetical protein